MAVCSKRIASFTISAALRSRSVNRVLEGVLLMLSKGVGLQVESALLSCSILMTGWVTEVVEELEADEEDRRGALPLEEVRLVLLADLLCGLGLSFCDWVAPVLVGARRGNEVGPAHTLCCMNSE
jgi:hypothetical protein